MPRATVTQTVERKELESCPGGWVDLKPLPFGLMLARRDKAARMSMQSEANAPRNAPTTMSFEFMQHYTRVFEFGHCIVDHNLEDEAGNKLNFNLEGTLDILDPEVGKEIESLIDEINKEESQEEEEAFPKRSKPASREIPATSATPS